MSTHLTTKANPSSKPRLIYIDLLNILAIFAALLLHHNGIVHTFSPDRSWATSLVIECVFYFAVPIFIMVTGATLLGYRQKYTTKTFFKKRALKVFIPALAWMLIMFFWKVCITKTLTITNWSPAHLANLLFANKEEPIYYYLFAIAGLYLTIPLLSHLTEPKHRRTLWYGVIVFFIFNALLPNLLALFGITTNSYFSLQIGNYIVYLFLGYLLSTQELSPKQRYLLYALGIGAILYRYFTTFFFSEAAGHLIKTTWGYTQFHTILLASAVFVFVKHLRLNHYLSVHSKLSRLLATLASCSFGIYLCHQIVRYYEFQIFKLDSHTWQYRLLWPLITYLISLAFVHLLKKLPLLRHLVP